MEIRSAPASSVEAVWGQLDPHDKHAELRIGGLRAPPSLRSIIRYYGHDLIASRPGGNGALASLDAVFQDDAGHEVLSIRDNVWQGNLDQWSIHVQRNRISVHSRRNHVALALRLEPPGAIAVDYMDMRIEDAHIIATKESCAVGRYIDAEGLCWVVADLEVSAFAPDAAAIEFADQDDLEQRVRENSHSIGLSAQDGLVHMIAGAGVVVPKLGISLASRSLRTKVRGLAIGCRPLGEVRRILRNCPIQITRYIATGNA
jgi:hypothetical protein